MMSKDIIHMDSVLVDLYMILDNIDTFSDIAKGDYEAFYKATMKEVQKREQYYNLSEMQQNTPPSEVSTGRR